MHGQLLVLMVKLWFEHFDIFLYMCVYVRGWYLFVLMVAVHSPPVIMKVLVVLVSTMYRGFLHSTER